MSFDPYLFFTGTCREAMTRYQEIFGGELSIMANGDAPAGGEMPGAGPDAVLHAGLKIGDRYLMASDDPTGTGGPKVGVAICHTAPDAGEAKRIFDALAEGGEVQMPMGETFFSPAFGACLDRFGVSWMVMVEQAQ
ncbi:VOC family protein [Sporichthya brevicatena]|uniref:VOC family protein n=1 Tax=Sporichthya brevicatena TaxID=171442 RepID=A0ABN1HCA5_9ACTN